MECYQVFVFQYFVGKSVYPVVLEAANTAFRDKNAVLILNSNKRTHDSNINFGWVKICHSKMPRTKIHSIHVKLF